jgi:uncharacterized protein (DUF1499 family)
MAEALRRRNWPGRLASLALVLSLGGVLAALIAAIGTGQDWWPFRPAFTVLRYAFFAAIGGAIGALIALLAARGAARPWRRGLLALIVGGAFIAFLGSQIVTARSVPAIHDISTDLDDLPEFRALQVRPDNLDAVPDEGDPALVAMTPEARWKALHRRAYPDIQPISVPWSVRETIERARVVAEEKGWEIVHFDPAAGRLEATDTSLFFRFKDDVAIRARRDPEDRNRTRVDMRSISRLGVSDVGVNAKRIREFLTDLRQS